MYRFHSGFSCRTHVRIRQIKVFMKVSFHVKQMTIGPILIYLSK